MKNLAFFALSLAACCWTGSVVAQTCDADSVQTITAPTTITGNTCPAGVAAGGGAVSAVCSGATPLNGNGAVVYSMTLGATNSVSVSLQSTGTGATSACDPTGNNCPFQPGLFVLSKAPTPTTTCGNETCLVSQQATTQGATVSGTVAANRSAGTYYIVVGDSGSDGLSNTGCGPYSLAVSGTLPVKLQKFSVN